MHAFNLTPITIALFNVTLVASMLTTAGGESHGMLIPFLTYVTIVLHQLPLLDHKTRPSLNGLCNTLIQLLKFCQSNLPKWRWDKCKYHY